MRRSRIVSRVSTLKTAIVALAVVAGLTGIAFATGLVSLRRGEAEGSDPQAASERSAKDLESLGYVGAESVRASDKTKVGVVRNLPEQAHPGLNLYTPTGWGRRFQEAGGGDPMRVARLIDMNGKALHKWDTDFLQGKSPRGWAMAKLGPDAALVAVNARGGLIKLDWDNETIWAVEERYHHDLEINDDGSIWVLQERAIRPKLGGTTFDLLDSGVTLVSADGEPQKTWWMHDLFRNEPWYRKALEDALEVGPDGTGRRKGGGSDFQHANTIDVLPADSQGRWVEGDLITCLRNMDMVVVMDQKDGRPKWHWGVGELDHSHDPDMLANGNLLIFDNGMRRKWSRVVEVDPATGKIVWQYDDRDPKNTFYSYMRGLSQRLPNGNTLITSSQRGRAFEVTPDKEIVWEFFSPDLLAKGTKRVPFRMVRLEGKVLEAALERLGMAPDQLPGAPVAARGDLEDAPDLEDEEDPAGDDE